MSRSRIWVSLALVLPAWVGAEVSDDTVPPAGFLEYLAAMVSQDDGWVDPLMLENAVLEETEVPTDAAASAEPVVLPPEMEDVQ